jgi:nitroreductase
MEWNDMTYLDLTPDQLLSTTRSVRKRLDLTRPVEPEVLRECIELAVQAPSGSNTQMWHFVIVTDPDKKLAIADFYRKGWAAAYGRGGEEASSGTSEPETEKERTARRVRDSAQYLADHMHEVPVLVIPCIRGRVDNQPTAVQAGVWGSILPAVWSFMLAARARGLGTVWTTLHLGYEQQVAEILGIPYAKFTQAALIPVAYTLGTDFKPGPRKPLDDILHWNGW